MEACKLALRRRDVGQQQQALQARSPVGLLGEEEGEEVSPCVLVGGSLACLLA